MSKISIKDKILAFVQSKSFKPVIFLLFLGAVFLLVLLAFLPVSISWIWVKAFLFLAYFILFLVVIVVRVSEKEERSLQRHVVELVFAPLVLGLAIGVIFFAGTEIQEGKRAVRAEQIENLRFVRSFADVGSCQSTIKFLNDNSGEKYDDLDESKQEKLNRSNFYDLNLRDQPLAFTNFSGDNLSLAKLNDAQLYGSCFFGSILGGTDFRDANLALANFRSADLEGADFRGAENLEFACFLGADNADKAKWSNSFNYETTFNNKTCREMEGTLWAVFN